MRNPLYLLLVLVALGAVLVAVTTVSSAAAASVNHSVKPQPWNGVISPVGPGFYTADGFTGGKLSIWGKVVIGANSCVTITGGQPTVVEFPSDLAVNGLNSRTPALEGKPLHVTINCPAGVKSLRIYGYLSGEGLLTNNRPATLFLRLHAFSPGLISGRITRMFTWNKYGFNGINPWHWHWLTKDRGGCAFLFTLNRRGPIIQALQHCVY